MSTLAIKIQPKTARRMLVEIDADKFERLAAGLGLFREEFLESLNRAEKEVAQGKLKRLKDLQDLRNSKA